MWRFSALVAVLVLGVTHVASARISITADFDHGSLLSWSGNLIEVDLVGRDNYYGDDKWRWLYFKASNVQNSTPTFTISRNFAGDATPGLHELEEHEMVYSYDNEHWFFFDNNQLGQSTYTFSNNTPFSQSEVYIAYAIPYSYGRSVAHTQTVLSSPWAGPTTSGDANGVIGQSAPGVDDVGRNVPALDVFGYRITNPATDAPDVAKRKIVITSGLHAGEPLGTWTYQGMVDWLISDDPRAAWIRDHVEVLGYPVLNPTGRFAGTNRTTVNNIGRDPNGLWDATRWSNGSFGCGGDNCQEIRATGEAMVADVAATPGAVDAFIDFHSTVPDYQIDEVHHIPDDFAYFDPDDADADWWRELELLQPNVLQEPSGGGNFTTAGFARRILGAEVEVTFETQFTWERNTDYYLNLGRNFGIAFYNAWAPDLAGDYNDDGVVDAADYVVWRNSMGGGGALANDDTPGVDQDDYERWRANFGTTATSLGSGSAGGIAAQVPEPGCAVLALFILLPMALVSPRLCRGSMPPPCRPPAEPGANGSRAI